MLYFTYIIHNIFNGYLQLQICLTPLLPPYNDSEDMANPEVINFVVKQTSDKVTTSIFVELVSALHHQW
jgi:hypothetical protein